MVARKVDCLPICISQSTNSDRRVSQGPASELLSYWTREVELASAGVTEILTTTFTGSGDLERCRYASVPDNFSST